MQLYTKQRDQSILLIYFIMNDKKLIASFRNFVDRIFLPNLKKTDPAVIQWNKFNQLLSIDSNNYEEAYQYSESIGMPNNPPSFTPLEKREIPLFKKRTDNEAPSSTSGESASFNPSKTFGGERARMMFMKGEMEEAGEQKQGGFGFGTGRNNEEKRNMVTSPQAILPGLERLCKTFLQNQGRIENLLNNMKPGKYM